MRRNLFIALALLLIAGLGYLLGWSNLITAKSVVIKGAPTAGLEKQISEIAKVKVGAPLARIEPQIIKSQVEKLDWIDSVSVNRNWFSGEVTVSIKQRVAIASVDGKYVDKTGFIFQAASLPSKALPQIIAPDTSTRQGAIDLFLSFPDSFASNVSLLTATGNEFLITQGRYGINWGRAAQNELKIKVFERLIALPENAKINYLDLSNPKSPIVR